MIISMAVLLCCRRSPDVLQKTMMRLNISRINTGTSMTDKNTTSRLSGTLTA